MNSLTATSLAIHDAFGMTKLCRSPAHHPSQLVSAGLSNRAIADTLVLSERTVEGHVRNTLAKLQLANRTELTAWVLRGTPHPDGLDALPAR